MIHHVVLYKLKPEVTPARVEAMMMNTRMQLLKIPEVLNIKYGKRLDPELPWPFFIAIDFESMDKYAIFREDSIFVKFMEEVIKPNIEDSLDLDFEMDPGKDVRFSQGWVATCGALGEHALPLLFLRGAGNHPVRCASAIFTPGIQCFRRRFATRRCWRWKGSVSSLRSARCTPRSRAFGTSISIVCARPFSTHRRRKS